MAQNIFNTDVDILGDLTLPLLTNEPGKFLQINAFNQVTFREANEVATDLGLYTSSQVDTLLDNYLLNTTDTFTGELTIVTPTVDVLFADAIQGGFNGMRIDGTNSAIDLKGGNGEETILTTLNNGDFRIYRPNIGGYVFTITPGGNVGIDTVTPESQLTVNGAIQLPNQTSLTWADIGDGTANRVRIQGNEDADWIRLVVDNNNNHVLHLDTIGVGIGILTPTEKLHVAGNALIESNAILRGSVELSTGLDDGLSDDVYALLKSNSGVFEIEGKSEITLNSPSVSILRAIGYEDYNVKVGIDGQLIYTAPVAASVTQEDINNTLVSLTSSYQTIGTFTLTEEYVTPTFEWKVTLDNAANFGRNLDVEIHIDGLPIGNITTYTIPRSATGYSVTGSIPSTNTYSSSTIIELKAKVPAGSLDVTNTTLRIIKSGGIGVETDPVFQASPAGGITQNEIDNWNSLESDKYYQHVQMTPNSVWTVNHGLNKRPSVTVVDSANQHVIGDVEYTGLNSLTITFNNAFSGTAECN